MSIFFAFYLIPLLWKLLKPAVCLRMHFLLLETKHLRVNKKLYSLKRYLFRKGRLQITAVAGAAVFDNSHSKLVFSCNPRHLAKLKRTRKLNNIRKRCYLHGHNFGPLVPKDYSGVETLVKFSNFLIFLRLATCKAIVNKANKSKFNCGESNLYWIKVNCRNTLKLFVSNICLGSYFAPVNISLQNRR